MTTTTATTHTQPAPQAERWRVLLLDDEPNVIDAMALSLGREFDIVTTTSPAEALALVRERSFAAIISDLRMPEMDGVTLLETVRRFSPGTARILLTGQGDTTSAIAAINMAAVHLYLRKPCPAKVVAEAIRKAVAANNGMDGETLSELGRKATLGVLAGSIGHEIGNLLVALGSSVAAVRERAADGRRLSDEEIAMDIAILDLVNVRLQEHAAQLRDLSRPRPLQVDDVDVSTIVVQTVGIMQRVGSLRLARVSTALPVGPANARIDRASIEGVLMNLLKNSAEALETRVTKQIDAGFIPEPSRINVRVRVDQSKVWLEVEDNGCGIAPEDLARLFEPFRTTKGRAGSGLGLGVVRSVLERQGGAIAFKSTVDVGTRVVVELPRSLDA